MQVSLQSSSAEPLQGGRRQSSRRGRFVVVPVLLITLLLIAGGVATDYWTTLPADTVPTFVGRQSCVECHQQQAATYHASDHDLAMDIATDATVLGDFGDQRLEHHGIVSRMFRSGQRFMVHTEGADGKMADFEVKYVFGVEPLQQYMVEFDRDAGTPVDAISRLQVLRISWDTEAKRWFHLDPPDVSEKLAPTDDLHWTGIAQRWNTMCAECHSTNLKKNFDPDTLRYHTTFSEIDVSCEACHGPGSTHVQLAQGVSLFWDRNLGYALADLKSDGQQAEMDTCAPCHSRRGTLAEGFTAGDRFHDFYSPMSLSADLYHADGQILDEVFEFGSFTQSKMHHKGIRCTDCHDPHSLQLKMPGNQVCTSCHQHPAGKYDTPAHHKHQPGSAGASCVECHMPATTFMEVDERRDHSLRIPRPDLSVSLGTPNACTGCHLDPRKVSEEKRASLEEYADWQQQAAEGDTEVRGEIARVDAWCDQACDQWYGDQRTKPPHFAEVLARFRRGDDPAADALATLARDVLQAPAIARATALEELAELVDPRQLPARVRAGRAALRDADPMVRAAAIRATAGEALGQGGDARLASQLGPLLEDPSRLVRSTAARTLASTGTFRRLSMPGQQRFEFVVDEIQEGLVALSDRGGAHVEWALLCEALGRFDQAMEAYQTAIRVEPRMAGPRSNLASLMENLLAAQAPSGQVTADQAQAAGERIKTLRAEELELLERDALLAPENGPLRYRLALSYYLNGDMQQALESSRKAVEIEPENADFQQWLRLLHEKLQSAP